MDGSRRREGNKQKKPSCCCFALCLEFQPRRSMRRTARISHHEIPTLSNVKREDRYRCLELLDDGSDGDVQREDSCVAQGWRSRGQRKEGEQRERYPILDEVDGRKQPGHSLPEYNGHPLQLHATTLKTRTSPPWHRSFKNKLHVMLSGQTITCPSIFCGTTSRRSIFTHTALQRQP